MNEERTELAELFANYLQGTLVDESIPIWERLTKSSDPTIINGCQILADQVDDTLFDSQLLDKSEWDYIERVRLALLGNALIVKRETIRFGWRNVLSGVGFFAFILFAIEFGIGYQLLPATALLGLLLFTFSSFMPETPSRFAYQNIVSPFTSFSDLKKSYGNADSFKKIRYKKTIAKQTKTTFVNHCLRWVIGCATMTMISPLILLVFTFPDTEPEYQAMAR